MRSAVVGLVLISLAAVASSRTRFQRYPAWNSRMFPVWRDDDPRHRDSWKGGEVTFHMASDAPTLTGAEVTFNVSTHPPGNQSALPDGSVVWSRNCTVDGTPHAAGEHVYPELNATRGWAGVFPDGTPFATTTPGKRAFVFVWKAWGRYWQVAGGASSSLTVGTGGVAPGSYAMEVVIYHCRGRDRFVPLGYVSTQFSVTDQIPLSVALSQPGDVVTADRSFARDRPVTFSVDLHDPSRYLLRADVSFTWDFGDGSGTLVSRQPSVTHTYTAAGSFGPRLVVAAAFPDACVPGPTAGVAATTVTVPSEAPPAGTSPQPARAGTGTPAVPAVNDLAAGTAEPAGGDAPTAVPAVPAVPAEPTEPAVPAATDAAAGAGASLAPPAEGAVEPGTPVPVSEAAAVANGTDTATLAPVTDVTINAAATGAAAPVPPVVPVAEGVAVNQTPATGVALSASVPGPAEVSVATVTQSGTASTQAALVIAKRQAPETCTVFRYGSFSQIITVVQGIESVEIVEVSSVAVVEQNAVDLTITCQGSLPSEVCTTVSDPDCAGPLQTECGPVSPSPGCLLTLRRFFNDSGTFCINVSLANDVSLAVASARLSVSMGEGSSSAGAVTAVLGVLVLIGTVAAVAVTYRRTKPYRALREDPTEGIVGNSGFRFVPMMVWNLLHGQQAGESRPLLQGRVV